MKKMTVLLLVAILSACNSAPAETTSAETAITDGTSAASETAVETTTAETAPPETTSHSVQLSTEAKETETEAVEAEPQSKGFEVYELSDTLKEDYRALLMEQYQSEIDDEITSFTSAFQLADLNGDGSPELMLSDGDYHLAQVRVFTADEEGRAKEIANAGSFGRFYYLPEKDLFYENYDGMGAFSRCVMRMNGDKFDSVIFLYKQEQFDDGSEDTIYQIDEKDVTEEEYSAAYDEYFSGKAVTLGRDLPITEGTINAVLDGASREDSFKAITEALGLQDAYWGSYVSGSCLISGGEELLTLDINGISIYGYNGRAYLKDMFDEYNDYTSYSPADEYELYYADDPDKYKAVYYDEHTGILIYTNKHYFETTAVYRRENGKFVGIDGWAVYTLKDGSALYTSDGKVITEDECIKLQEKYTGIDRLDIDPFPNGGEDNG